MILKVLFALVVIYTIIELIFYHIQEVRFFKRIKKFDPITYKGEALRFLSYDKSGQLNTIDEYGILRKFSKDKLVKDNVDFKSILILFDKKK